MKFPQAWVALLVVGTVAAQVPPPRFQSGVEVVEVTLLVRDGAGRPVTDLRQDEIAVLDKGMPQKIVAFARISLPIRPAPADTPPVGARDVSSNDGLRESRVFMLVLDALHVSGLNVRTVRQHAREFVERHVGPNDLAAVFSPGGLAAATEDFTTDKARLLAAIDQFNASKLPSATVERYKEMLAGTSVVHEGKDPDDFERARRAQALADVLRALAANVERIGGRRKAMLLFSEGTDYNAGDVMGVVQRYATDVVRDLDRAVGALMRANVALYAVDPRRLNSASDTLIETPIYNPFPTPGSVSSRGVEEEYGNSIRNLRDLSELTGGFAAVDTNDAGPAFARIVEESSEYYVVAYAPDKPGKAGEFRPISVETSRRGVTIVARKGYTARGPVAAATAQEPLPAPSMSPAPVTGIFDRRRPSAPVEMDPPATTSRRRGVDDELALLLSSPLPKPGLPLRVQAIPFKGNGRKHVVRLLVEILGAELQFGERRGRAEERIDLALITVDDRGRASNGRSTAIDLSLPPEELRRVRATGVRWLSKLDLPPGRHQVRVAARAARTGATGMITHVVDVPKYEPGRLSMSGVTMTSLPALVMPTRGPVWTEKTFETPPSASRAFVAGDQVTAAVDVYAPPAAAGPIEVFADVEGVEPAPRRIAAESRGASTVFRIDTGTLKPGTYVLRVVAAAGSERVERRVPFAVVKNGDTQRFAK